MAITSTVRKEAQVHIIPPATRQMVVPFGFATRVIYAGPYSRRPHNMFGVKLAPEVTGPAHITLPIRDFGVPNNKALTEEVVARVLRMLAENYRPVYVGCYGGLGRTGLFLSLLVKTMGVARPVEYVRQNYQSKAVETETQYAYVNLFKPPLSRWDARWLKLQALWWGRQTRV